MQEKELVSIVVPTYNRTDELQRALTSIVNQTYKNIEVIIIDDNADFQIKNAVKKIVSSFRDERLKLYVNKKNLGAVKSRNKGITKSKGEYIAFLDDDDEYLENRIEVQIMKFRCNTDPRLALVYGHCREVTSTGKEVNYEYTYRGNCLYEAMLDCIAATSQWMCIRKVLIQVGMFTNMPCKQDSYVLIKMLALGYTIDYVPRILSIYHAEGNNRISSQKDEKRIVGEEKLRRLCRQNYCKISVSKIYSVELKFAEKLVDYYINEARWAGILYCLVLFCLWPFEYANAQQIKKILKYIM